MLCIRTVFEGLHLLFFITSLCLVSFNVSLSHLAFGKFSLYIPVSLFPIFQYLASFTDQHFFFFLIRFIVSVPIDILLMYTSMEQFPTVCLAQDSSSG